MLLANSHVGQINKRVCITHFEVLFFVSAAFTREIARCERKNERDTGEGRKKCVKCVFDTFPKKNIQIIYFDTTINGSTVGKNQFQVASMLIYDFACRGFPCVLT